jgi:hypothetical protein
VHLLFLQAHRETDRFFTASRVHLPQSTFHFRRVSFSSVVVVGGVYYDVYVNGDSVESHCRFIKGTNPHRSLELSPLSLSLSVQITNSI